MECRNYKWVVLSRMIKSWLTTFLIQSRSGQKSNQWTWQVCKNSDDCVESMYGYMHFIINSLIHIKFPVQSFLYFHDLLVNFKNLVLQSILRSWHSAGFIKIGILSLASLIRPILIFFKLFILIVFRNRLFIDCVLHIFLLLPQSKMLIVSSTFVASPALRHSLGTIFGDRILFQL